MRKDANARFLDQGQQGLRVRSVTRFQSRFGSSFVSVDPMRDSLVEKGFGSVEGNEAR